MALTLKSLARGARRLAKRAILDAATVTLKATPLGNAAYRAGVAVKQLGGKIQGARAMKRQGQAVNAAVTALANAKRPGIMSTPRGTEWIDSAKGPDLTTRSDESSKSSRKRKRTTKGSASSTTTSGRKTGSGRTRAKRRGSSGSSTRSSEYVETYPSDTEEDEREKERRRKGSSSTRRKAARKSTRPMHPKMKAQADHMTRLAAKWRAAGKPGKWIDYVKANPLKG